MTLGPPGVCEEDGLLGHQGDAETHIRKASGCGWQPKSNAKGGNAFQARAAETS